MTHATPILWLLLITVSVNAAEREIPPAFGPHINLSASDFAGSKSFSTQDRIVGTYFFYWYDCYTKSHIIDPDGTDALTTHPPTLEDFSYKSARWFRQQLADMEAAGIDVALMVYWGAPSEHDPEAHLYWSFAGLKPLVEAREQLLREGRQPPRIGLFYDTSTLQHNTWGYHADLTTDYGKRWFYASVRDFFSFIPPKHWAMIDGKPIVLLYAAAFAKKWDQSFIDYTKAEFPKQFGGRVPWIAPQDSWHVKGDDTCTWGGALGYRNPGIGELGPGYDHSAVPGRQPLVRQRENGKFYEDSWRKFLEQPTSFVMIETWNEFHEGTDIAESKEYGRQYIELTRKYSELFKKVSSNSTSTQTSAAPASDSKINHVIIDFARTNGMIRPLHGVNLGPLCYRGMVDLSARHRELAVPFTRTHDVVWVNAEAVDIHTIFPDFRNDPAQPDNYFFAPTDDYLQAINAVGSKVVYRLGESIEHTKRKYHVHPPPDPEKWAAICAGIIRHYNEGWADGFRLGIPYWEIWNEPDVRPQMWTGDDEQFLRLFEVTAKAIKARFPNVKVGGPAVGNPGDFVGETFRPAPFTSKFLDYCREHNVPLDFFSWHRYTSDPWDLPRRAQAVRRLLDEHGFTSTESHCNEWNYLPHDDWSPLSAAGIGVKREHWFAEMGGPRGAAFAATVLLLWQDRSVDVANFYTGEIQGFGLFDFNGVPRKNFYAFLAFRELLKAPVRVATPISTSGQMTLGAGVSKDGQCATVLVSNFNSAITRLEVVLANLPWKQPTLYEVMIVDAERNLEHLHTGEVSYDGQLTLSSLTAPTIALIKLMPAKQP